MARHHAQKVRGGRLVYNDDVMTPRPAQIGQYRDPVSGVVVRVFGMGMAEGSTQPLFKRFGKGYSRMARGFSVESVGDVEN